MATPKKSTPKVAKKKAAPKKGNKTGLIFPVGRCGGLLKRGRYAKRVARSSAVYMAAVLEYLTTELLELSCKSHLAMKKKSKRLSPRAVTLAVRHDQELGQLLKDVTLSRGGVLPGVNPALEKKAKHAKKTKHGKKH